MNGINLRPLSAREVSVGPAEDAYKKYWWAILAGFVLTGAWLCMPLMETPVGSAHVDAPQPAQDASSAEQSLDAAANPSGAAGSSIDLSMDVAKAKSKTDEDMTSMLYQAPPESGAAAAGVPVAAASGGVSSLAQQLKDAGKKGATGWGEKAQSGFSVPHLGGGGLSGLGSAAGGSSASSGGANAFGSNNAHVGFESTVGLHGDGGAAESESARSLQRVAAAAKGLNGSAEALHSSMSNVFDAGKGKKPAGIGSGMSDAMVSAHAALDAAPDNLKVNDPKLDAKTLPEPPAAPTPASDTNSMQQLGQSLVMIAATALIGGMIPGVGGQMVMMMGMAAMQQQQAAAAAAKTQPGANAAKTSITGTP